MVVLRAFLPLVVCLFTTAADGFVSPSTTTPTNSLLKKRLLMKAPQQTLILHSVANDGNDGDEADDAASSAPELRAATPEELEEYLNNLAQQIRTEIPMDQPVVSDNKMELIQSWAGDYDKAKARSILERVIRSNPCLVFGFTTCRFTIQAKQILDQQGISYTARDFDTLPTPAEGYALRAELADMLNNRTSVPAIFVNSEYIGGCDDGLKPLVESGELQRRLLEQG